MCYHFYLVQPVGPNIPIFKGEGNEIYLKSSSILGTSLQGTIMFFILLQRHETKVLGEIQLLLPDLVITVLQTLPNSSRDKTILELALANRSNSIFQSMKANTTEINCFSFNATSITKLLTFYVQANALILY